jgi:hypothetical protein
MTDECLFLFNTLLKEQSIETLIDVSLLVLLIFQMHKSEINKNLMLNTYDKQQLYLVRIT